MKPIEICSDKEFLSFLVPAYGFEYVTDAKAYLQSDAFAKGNFKDSNNAYTPIFGYRTYVPLGNANYTDLLTTTLVEGLIQCNKPIWEVLRKKEAMKPKGSYNVALLVEGRRQFYRSHRQTTKHPKWWYSLSDGIKDCYAVWGRKDEAKLYNPILEKGSVRVYPLRAGRGVIYSLETEFDNKGKPAGFRSVLVMVEFVIYDRDPAKDDMMRVKIFHHNIFAKDFELFENLDDVWIELIERAKAGFAQWCNPVAPEIEEWRQFFVKQREKAEADHRKPYEQSFAGYIKDLTWQKALEAVREPWQLAIVASYHGRRPEFSSDGGVYTIPYETVPAMIHRHNCSSERRAELMKMIHEYVEPSDNLWNYRGD